jgi:hypothetical protein
MAALDGAFVDDEVKPATGVSGVSGEKRDGRQVGAAVALWSVGAQDAYSAKADIFPAEYRLRALGLVPPEAADFNVFSGRHFVTYGRIEASRGPWHRGFTMRDAKGATSNCLTLTLDKDQCGLVGCVDLALPVWNSGKRLGIRSVTVTIGGAQMDRWGAEGDMDTQIRASAALFGRSVTVHGPGPRRAFVPLALGPFQSPLPLLDRHEIQVTVRFEPEYLAAVRLDMRAGLAEAPKGDSDDIPGIELYGDRYWLLNPQHLRAFAGRDAGDDPEPTRSRFLEVMTMQSQYCGAERVEAVDRWGSDGSVVAGLETRVRLCFNHPVQLIYFWGAPAITDARLELEDSIIVDCPAAALERAKVARLGAAAAAAFQPHAMFFSGDPVGQATRSSINFSRIDKATLVVTTAPGSPGGELHVVGVNQQLMRIGSGMAGLAFSK